MCGIAARIATGDVLDDLLAGLRALEFPGYDAAGVAIVDGSRIRVHGRAGGIDDPVSALDPDASGRLGLGYTQWSSTADADAAPVSPHTDCTETVAVVADGTVWNYESLREELRSDGHELDGAGGTEVVPHLVERRIAAGDSPDEALRSAARRIEGNYAVAMVVEDRDAIYATRSGSSLVLGVADDGYFLASDAAAFRGRADAAVFLEDEDLAVVTPTMHAVTDLAGDLVVRSPEPVGRSPA